MVWRRSNVGARRRLALVDPYGARLCMRDILLPLFWVDAWVGNSFTWRGTDLRPREAIEASR
jgi:hypothetical protein